MLRVFELRRTWLAAPWSGPTSNPNWLEPLKLRPNFSAQQEHHLPITREASLRLYTITAMVGTNYFSTVGSEHPAIEDLPRAAFSQPFSFVLSHITYTWEYSNED